MSVSFSCDLVSNAKKYRQFLIEIHVFNMSTFVSHQNDPPNGTKMAERRLSSEKEVESLRRYQYFWLPLVADKGNSNVPLIPPPDIAWLWHCHRLSPQQYSQYCHETFHHRDSSSLAIEANPPFAFASPEHNNNDDVVNTTMQLWKDTYPNQSFFLSSDAFSGKHSIRDNDLSIADFDLIGSARRQATFLWQVSGDPYKCDLFLQNGRDNYEKFLKLTIPAKQLNIIVVPTYQIDIMWHTHILSSINAYNNDCLRLVNSTIHHDDSIDGHKDGGILDVSYSATERLWTSVYNTEYNVQGGMYRGEPPPEFFKAMPTSPRPWVKLDETASDGRDAFIPTSAQKRKDIKKLLPRPHYVLGRCHDKTGYFHIETWEAHFILYHRIKDRLSTMQQELAGACGIWVGPKQRKARTEEVDHVNRVREQLYWELFYPKIAGLNQIPVAPDVLLECAGGSCGGAMAFKSPGTYR